MDCQAHIGSWQKHQELSRAEDRSEYAYIIRALAKLHGCKIIGDHFLFHPATATIVAASLAIVIALLRNTLNYLRDFAMRESVKRSGFALAALVVSGCADVSTVQRHDQDAYLHPKAATYVAIPQDGRFGEIVYMGSGTTVAGIVVAGFSGKLPNIRLGERYQPYEVAFRYAQDSNFHYLIVPTILHWEDRSTAWSGRPSKSSIRIVISDVGTGEIVDSAVIDSRSSKVRMTDPSPEDGLPKPVAEYVNSLQYW